VSSQLLDEVVDKQDIVEQSHVKLSLAGTVGIPTPHPLVPDTIEMNLGQHRASSLSDRLSLLSHSNKVSNSGESSNPDASAASTPAGSLPSVGRPYDIWQIAGTLLTNKTAHITGILPSDIEGFQPRGWDELVREAVIIPMTTEDSNKKVPDAILIMGLNSRRPYDEDYKNWIDAMRTSLASTLAAVLFVESSAKQVEQILRKESPYTPRSNGRSHGSRSSCYVPCSTELILTFV
jgi:hypothetical protein